MIKKENCKVGDKIWGIGEYSPFGKNPCIVRDTVESITFAKNGITVEGIDSFYSPEEPLFETEAEVIEWLIAHVEAYIEQIKKHKIAAPKAKAKK